MFIRRTEEKDIAECAAIYAAAREYMKTSGNPTQWQGSYPSEADVAEDIKNGFGYVCIREKGEKQQENTVKNSTWGGFFSLSAKKDDDNKNATGEEAGEIKNGICLSAEGDKTERNKEMSFEADREAGEIKNSIGLTAEGDKTERNKEMSFEADREAGEIVAVFFLSSEPDPTYAKIDEGEWLSDEPYLVIHRIATKYHGEAIADFIFDECYKRLPHIRIDTHENNIPMQRVLKRCGFSRRGVIYLKNSDPRIAFEKI